MAEYVLPKFDVTIDSASDFSAKDGKIRAIIRSKYTYGKLVKGEAIVSLSRNIGMYYNGRIHSADAVLKTVPIDGKGTVEFDIETDLQMDGWKRYYEMRATVVEELTGRNQSATKEITIHAERYNIQAIDMGYNFNPGIPKTFSVSLTYSSFKI